MIPRNTITRRRFVSLATAGGLGALGILALAGCGEAQVVTETKIERVTVEVPVEKVVTQIVEKEKVVEKSVEKIVTQIVEKEKIVEKVVTVVTGPTKPAVIELNVINVEAYGPEEDKIVFDGYYKIFTDQTGIKIKNTLLPENDQINVKMLTMIAGGTPPDIAYVHPQYLPGLASKGVLHSVDEYVKKDGINLSDYYENILEYFRFPIPGGPLYGFPWYSGPSLTIFNKTLFDDAGVPDPKSWDAKEQWNWEKLHEVTQQIASGEGAERIFGFRALTPSLKVLAPVVWEWGGDLWDADMTNTLLDKPEAVAALQQYADLQWKEKVAPTAAETEGLAGGLKSGRIAIDSWSIKGTVPSLRDVPFEKGMANFPFGPKGRFVRNGPNSFCIFTAAKFPEEAWELMKGMAGPDFFALANSIGATLPVKKELMRSPEFLASLEPWEDIEVYEQASLADKAARLPGTFVQIQTAFTAEFSLVMLGKKTQAEAMEAFAPIAKELLAEAKEQ